MDISLIEQEDFDIISSISRNIDPAWYVPYIYTSQDFYIEDRLGIDLLDELKTQKDTNTLTVLNQTLLNGNLTKAIVYYTLYEALPFIHTRIENKGVTVNKEDTQEAVDENILADRGLKIKLKADAYMKKVIDYLEKNKTDYPLYISEDCGCNINEFTTFGIIWNKR